LESKDSAIDGLPVDEAKRLTSLFDLDTNERETSQSLPSEETRKPIQVDLTDTLEKYGPEFFDELRDGEPRTPIDAVKFVAEKWLTDLFSQLARNTTSQVFTGKSFDELPETFQKDYAVWDAAINRIMEPFSVKGGYELVDAFGGLLDLWNVE
jgi:hypothetical protein